MMKAPEFWCKKRILNKLIKNKQAQQPISNKNSALSARLAVLSSNTAYSQ